MGVIAAVTLCRGPSKTLPPDYKREKRTPGRTTLTVSCRPGELLALERIASQEGISLGALCRRVVELHCQIYNRVKNRPPKAKADRLSHRGERRRCHHR